MKKTSLLILGALMATMSLTVFANEKEKTQRENINIVQEEANFKVVDKVENGYQKLDYINGNTENNRPPYVEGAGCCNYMQGTNYR